ncbi:O-antigen ligase family protein [Sulfuriroseicoccus oceanibius]|uniref:O-antigen ligase family protein n=1 Tax=Sulfuriroseicoccus oceanibius TaxID=2707525 RepID=A0A6B3LAW6_9BACT|nr:O-antigen ligase family protein [Sulfuriroseicoccus oceanibius]QQL45632.1 O-antigen ligase family protein [Sulfuriroseicoccus oceanibius]
MSKVLDYAGQALTMLGFLFVAVLGTADNVPMAFPGVSVMGLGAVLTVAGWGLRERGRIRWGSVLLAFAGVGVLGCFLWRAMMSPVAHFAQLDVALIAALAAGLVVIVFGRWPVNLRWFGALLSLLTLVNLWIAVVQVVVEPGYAPWASLGLERPLDNPQASGFFFHQNPFGAFSAAAGLLLLGMARAKIGTGFERAVHGLGSLAAFVGVYLSFSRAAMLGAVVGLAVMAAVVGVTAVMRRRMSGPRRAAVMAGVVLALAGIGYGAMWGAERIISHRWGDRTGLEQLGKLDSRGDSWRLAMDVFQGSPVVGEGSRGFQDRQYDYWAADAYSLEADYHYAHNEYLQVLSDYGLVGGLLLLLAMAALGIRAVVLIGRGARAEKEAPAMPLVWRGAFAGLCALAADAVFSFNLHFVPVAALAGVMLGVMMRNLAPTSSGGARQVVRKPDVMAAVAWGGLLVVSVASVIAVVKPVAGSWWRWQLAEPMVADGSLGDLDQVTLARELYAESGDYWSSLRMGEVAWRVARSDRLEWSDRKALAEEALEAYAAAADVWPADPLPHGKQAEILLALGRFDEAEAVYQVAIERSGNRDRWFTYGFDLGLLYFTRARIAMEDCDHHAATYWLTLAKETLDSQPWPAVPERRKQWDDARAAVDADIALLKGLKEWFPESTDVRPPE